MTGDDQDDDDLLDEPLPWTAEDVLETAMTLIALLILSPIIIPLVVIAVFRHYRHKR